MNKHISRFLNDEENHNVLSGEIANKDEVFDDKLEKKLLREILLSGDLNEDAYLNLIKSNRREYSDLNVSALPENRIVILLDNKKLKFSTSNFDYLVDSDTDKYIDLIESDFNEFFDVRDELDLPEGTITKLMCSSVLLPQNKEKIIEDIYEGSNYDLFDEEDGLVRAIIDVCLQESITLEFETIEKLFEYEKERTKRIELLIRHASSLDFEQTAILLISLSEPYSKIVQNSERYTYLPKNDLNNQLAISLTNSGYIKKHWSFAGKFKIHLRT